MNTFAKILLTIFGHVLLALSTVVATAIFFPAGLLKWSFTKLSGLPGLYVKQSRKLNALIWD
jgi:hypothetical protein